MKKRTCDKCNNIIPAGALYYKVCSQQYVGKQLKSEHVGDLCQACWVIPEIPEDNGKVEEVGIDTGTENLF